MPTRAPHGSWKSPITSELIARASVRPTDLALDDDVYLSESRPEEGGRAVVVRISANGATHDVTPAGFNVRTRVHEYGGGAFAVSRGSVVFSNFADQRLYAQDAGGAPRPITAAGARRYADGVFDTRRGRLVCVLEDHSASGREPANSLVTVGLADGSVTSVASGADFYSSPRLSLDGERLAWLCWNHPNMPWDGTELWVGDLSDDGRVVASRQVAGGADESIFQPEWAPDGALYFASDVSGWWNLHRIAAGAIPRGAVGAIPTKGADAASAGSPAAIAVEPLLQMEAEFGMPQWAFGMSAYAVLTDGTLLVTYAERGRWYLARLDPAARRLERVDTPYSELSSIRASATKAVLFAASPAEAQCLVELDLATHALRVLRRFSTIEVDGGYLSYPEPIEFPTAGGATAHALYYRPKNRDFIAPDGERPPLIVKSHGGPTAAASSALSLRTQYWTSRGFAVLDVNYGGSTGYGRAYRGRLEGQWGVVDVDDCVAAARFIVKRGEADPARLAISGGSAGGYTTLAALTFRDLFKAGASHYGISDLEALARDTHKFESRYLDRLIGPYPDRRDLYVARSPIHHTERLACPIVFFQGLEDRVVPPEQSERMVEALRKKGLPVAYVSFEGEQHGFRRAESIRRSIDGELYFYSRVFGFEIAGDVEAIAIENL